MEEWVIEDDAELDFVAEELLSDDDDDEYVIEDDVELDFVAEELLATEDDEEYVEEDLLWLLELEESEEELLVVELEL